MSTMGKTEDIKYWSAKLEEASAKAAVLHTTYNMNTFHLDYVETHRVMELLMEYRSYSSLLSQTVAEPDEPKSLWQRIRNK